MEKYRAKYLPEKYAGKKVDIVWRLQFSGGKSCCIAAMINVLDDQVGEIIDKVHELGIAENTLIIFTSDNATRQKADPDYFDSNGPLKGHKKTFMRWDSRSHDCHLLQN